MNKMKALSQGEGLEIDHQKFFFAFLAVARYCGWAEAYLWANGKKLIINSDNEILPELKWIHAIPNGGKRDCITAASLKAQGVKSGIPDVFVPIPINSFAGLYIEFKAPSFGQNPEKGLTKTQKEFKIYAESVGYDYKVVSCWQNAISHVQNYLKW